VFSDWFAQGFRETLNDIYGVQSTVSHTRGGHLLKTGGEYRLYRLFRANVGNNNGRYVFSSAFTQRNPLQTDATSGVALASFLLGYPSSGTVDVNTESDQRYRNVDVFVQDDWKLSTKATLNVGLRWDYQAPVTELHNRQTVGFESNATNPFQLPAGTLNPATGQPIGTLHGGPLYAGVNGNSTHPYKGDWNNLQPRVGFTYRLTGWLAGVQLRPFALRHHRLLRRRAAGWLQPDDEHDHGRAADRRADRRSGQPVSTVAVSDRLPAAGGQHARARQQQRPEHLVPQS
jgi:hypothetical protein